MRNRNLDRDGNLPPHIQAWLQASDRSHRATGADRVDCIDLDAPRIEGRFRRASLPSYRSVTDRNL